MSFTVTCDELDWWFGHCEDCGYRCNGADESSVRYFMRIHEHRVRQDA